MNDFTIAMALVDYIPVALFAAAAIILMRDLYHKMSKSAFALFAGGAIMIAIAGALKATWKLLYAAKICDFAALNSMFFPTQSIGFLLAGLGILLMLLQKSGKSALLAVAPPVFTGTFVFVGLMAAKMQSTVSITPSPATISPTNTNVPVKTGGATARMVLFPDF